MSIFGAIRDAIFGGPANAAPATGEAPTVSVELPKANVTLPTAAPAELQPGAQKTAAPAGAVAGAAGAKGPTVDVAAVLDEIDADEDLDWRKSIVDLMKLLKIDSSLTARKSLAKELGYTGDMADSAKMNVWLHKQVMTKLAENGGKVPAELKH